MAAFCADDRSAPLLSDIVLLPSQFPKDCLCLGASGAAVLEAKPFSEEDDDG